MINVLVGSGEFACHVEGFIGGIVDDDVDDIGQPALLQQCLQDLLDGVLFVVCGYHAGDARPLSLVVRWPNNRQIVGFNAFLDVRSHFTSYFSFCPFG